MTAFVVVDAVLLVGFLVFLAIFLSGSSGGTGNGEEPGGAGTTGPSSSPGESTAPSGATAGEAATFALPSGNIACEITADAATCTIASSTAEPPADTECTGSVGQILTVTAEGAEMPCIEGALPGVAAPGTPVLEYGQSTTEGDFTCTSSSTGVTCKYNPTGAGFQLARAASKLF